jgi:hypothetical protein
MIDGLKCSRGTHEKKMYANRSSLGMLVLGARAPPCLAQTQCQPQLAKCVLSPKCFANLICINTCSNRPDEVREAVPPVVVQTPARANPVVVFFRCAFV